MDFVRARKFKSLSAFALVALTVLSSCGENPATDDGEPHCDHVDADGVQLVQGNVTLNHQFNGLNDGTVQVEVGFDQSNIEVVLLAEENVGGTPTPVPIQFEAGCSSDFALGWEVADPTILEASQSAGQVWSLNLRGLAPGSTSLQVFVVHGDHNDFVSLPISVTVSDSVSAPPIAPEALWVREGENVLGTWNHHPNGPGQVTGPILVERGTTRTGLEVVFSGPWDEGGGGHGSGGRPEIAIPEGPYALRWAVTPPDLVELQAVPGEVARINLVGHSVGMATVVLELLFRGSPILTSGPLPVVCVESTTAQVPTPSFTCVASGLKSIIVDQGAVLPALDPGEGAPCGWWTPGTFRLAVGEQTSLYSVREFRVFSDPCATNTISDSSYRLSFQFASPGVARIVNHPFHWSEITIFHLEGLAVGSTHLTIWVTDRTTGALRWVSPPLPVDVVAP